MEISVELETITVNRAWEYLLCAGDFDESAEEELVWVGAQVVAGIAMADSDFSVWFDADGTLQRGAGVLFAIRILQGPLEVPVVRGIPTDWDFMSLDISGSSAQVSRWVGEGLFKKPRSTARFSVPVTRAA